PSTPPGGIRSPWSRSVPAPSSPPCSPTRTTGSTSWSGASPVVPAEAPKTLECAGFDGSLVLRRGGPAQASGVAPVGSRIFRSGRLRRRAAQATGAPIGAPSTRKCADATPCAHGNGTVPNRISGRASVTTVAVLGGGVAGLSAAHEL